MKIKIILLSLLIILSVYHFYYAIDITNDLKCQEEQYNRLFEEKSEQYNKLNDCNNNNENKNKEIKELKKQNEEKDNRIKELEEQNNKLQIQLKN